MYNALTPLVGALITIMNGVNSRLSERVGYLVATILIHVVGLTAISVVSLARREERKPGRLPFYAYLGGFMGVGTVITCNYAFSAVSASLAVAVMLLGQAAFSVFADAVGLMGRTRRPLSARRLPGIALAVAGVAVIAGDWRSEALPIVVSLASGACTGMALVLNAELGRRKGVILSTMANYGVGLATTLVIVAFLRPPLAGTARAVAEAGPFLAAGGGAMGVVVVIASNLILPRIPVFSATLLMFSGQALAGVALDLVREGALDWRKLVGAVVVVAGFALDTILAKQPEEAA